MHERLSTLLDRRDYLPWRLVAGSFADSFVTTDRGPVVFVTQRTPLTRWHAMVNDLALRNLTAKAIGALPNLADTDRIATGELVALRAKRARRGPRRARRRACDLRVHRPPRPEHRNPGRPERARRDRGHRPGDECAPARRRDRRDGPGARHDARGAHHRGIGNGPRREPGGADTAARGARTGGSDREPVARRDQRRHPASAERAASARRERAAGPRCIRQQLPGRLEQARELLHRRQQRRRHRAQCGESTAVEQDVVGASHTNEDLDDPCPPRCRLDRRRRRTDDPRDPGRPRERRARPGRVFRDVRRRRPPGLPGQHR